jgi:hypothetical protein
MYAHQYTIVDKHVIIKGRCHPVDCFREVRTDTRAQFAVLIYSETSSCNVGFCGNFMIYSIQGEPVARINRFCSPEARPCYEHEGESTYKIDLYPDRHYQNRGVAIVYMILERGEVAEHLLISYKYEIFLGRLNHTQLEIINKHLLNGKKETWNGELHGFQIPRTGDIIVHIHNVQVKPPYRHIFYLKEAEAFKKKELPPGEYPKELISFALPWFDYINSRILYMSDDCRHGTGKAIIKAIRMDCNGAYVSLAELLDEGITYVKGFKKRSNFGIDRAGNIHLMVWGNPFIVNLYRSVPDLF